MGEKRNSASDKRVAFEELKNTAQPLTAIVDNKDGLILDEDDDIIEEIPKKEDIVEENSEYNGLGAVVEKLPEPEKSNGVKIGPMANKETKSAIDETLRDLDEQIMVEHKRFLELTNNGKNVERPSDNRKVNTNEEVTVLIDKLGLGELVFTEDEKKRISRSKKIKLVEVTNKELQHVKILKKYDKDKQKEFIQRSFNKSLSPVLALASGYTAKMKNVSAIESIQMIQRPGQDSGATMIEKWSLIYSKLTDFSCGQFESFDDFIAHTAYSDYNNFLFAILCSSYPEEDSVSFTCDRENCGKRFEIKYKNKDLIRTENITEEQAERIKNLVSASSNGNITDGKEYMLNSPVNGIERFLLEDNGFIVDIYIPSVKEQCEKILPSINRDLANENKRGIVLLAHNIHTILIPAEYEENGETVEGYVPVDDFEDIVDILGQMNEKELAIISNRITKLLTPFTINYGIKEIICPHCKHNYGELPTPLDDLLFQRVQARMTTELE